MAAVHDHGSVVSSNHFWSTAILRLSTRAAFDPLISEEAADTFLIQGPASNWIIARDGTAFTLIDSGYPADQDLVLASIESLGLKPADAAAMLITHGHTDHTGSAAHFAATYGTPILSSSRDRAQLLGDEKYQITVGTAWPHLWRPVVLRWALHAIRAGGMKDNDIPSAQAMDPRVLQALPGAPVAIPTPGHTPGHTSYLLPSAKALASGDALITGHFISDRTGPQMLHPMFHHDLPQALESLSSLTDTGAVVVLPGHGPAYRGSLTDAVSLAQL